MIFDFCYLIQGRESVEKPLGFPVSDL